jgi:hypothetical protein
MSAKVAAFVPDVMPLLSKGRHDNPEQGACLMEYTSVLAGERWSDHPACTHRVLAAIARAVNDLVDDSFRQRLAAEAAVLSDANADDPRVGPALLLICAQRAVTADPHNERRLRHVVGRATRWLATGESTVQRGRPPLFRSWLQPVFEMNAACMDIPHVLDLLGRTASPDELQKLLRECICFVRSVEPVAGRTTQSGRAPTAV